MRIAHVITRLILGGAQENTLLTCEDLLRDLRRRRAADHRAAVGPEGEPAGARQARRRRAAGSRPVAAARDPSAARRRDSYCTISRAIRRVPARRRPHAQRQGGHARPPGRLRAARAGDRPHGPRRAVSSVPGQGGRAHSSAAANAGPPARCHAMVSVADAMTDLMVAAGVAPREKFTTIYSGMEVEPFLDCRASTATASAASWATRDEHVVVGKIARLFHLKGHDDLVARRPRRVPEQSASAVPARRRRHPAATRSKPKSPPPASPTTSNSPAWCRPRRFPS